MMLTACSATGATKAKSVPINPGKVCPAPLIPSPEERAILREHAPQFYIDFANQQQDLMIAKEKGR